MPTVGAFCVTLNNMGQCQACDADPQGDEGPDTNSVVPTVKLGNCFMCLASSSQVETDKIWERQCQIPLTEHRAITLYQINDISGHIERTLELDQGLVDTNPQSKTHGARITWDMLNMYHTCEHIVCPITMLLR